MVYDIKFGGESEKTPRTRKVRSDKGRKHKSYNKGELYQAAVEARRKEREEKKQLEQELKEARRKKREADRLAKEVIKDNEDALREAKRAERQARAEAKAERKAKREAKWTEEEKLTRNIADRMKKLNKHLGSDGDYMEILRDDIDSLSGVILTEKTGILSVKSKLSKAELSALDKKVRNIDELYKEAEEHMRKAESMKGFIGPLDLVTEINAKAYVEANFDKAKKELYDLIQAGASRMDMALYEKLWDELVSMGSEAHSGTYTDMLKILDQIRTIAWL